MHIRIGLDKGYENKVLAYALDYPGCFASGEDDAEALLTILHALLKYEVWIKDHTDNPWVDFTEISLVVVDVWNTYVIEDDLLPELSGIEVNAFFKDDWRPLSLDETEKAKNTFTWQREELYAGISTLSEEVLARQYEDQRWNILGIMKHIANAENWYLSRLGNSSIPKNLLPESPIGRLELIQEKINTAFASFVDNPQVMGLDGEFWSCRKIIRRILWHQRDHIEHIKQLAFRD